MIKKLNRLPYIATVLTALLLASPAYAHEAYVLDKSQVATGMNDYSINVFSALKNTTNLKISVLVLLGSLVVFGLYFFFQHSRFGQKIDNSLKNLEPFGHVLLRFALALSFFASALTDSFLGPEIHLNTLPMAGAFRVVLFLLGLLLLVGFLSEVAGAIALLLLIVATSVYHSYMLTYVNYLGEFIVLIVFGSRFFSIDRQLFGISKFAEKYKAYEIALIRATYGLSILYPAITIKLMHPLVIIEIVNQYHLNHFHWLFPADPLLISLGAGLAQVAIGTFLILGFQTRLNTFVTFVLMVMSVMFFKEAVWPHYILLALALYLMINNGGTFSLDSYIQKWLFTNSGQ